MMELCSRWQDRDQPFYNQNLTIDGRDYRMAFPPDGPMLSRGQG